MEVSQQVLSRGPPQFCFGSQKKKNGQKFLNLRSVQVSFILLKILLITGMILILLDSSRPPDEFGPKKLRFCE
jgi:hypothetical protein